MVCVGVDLRVDARLDMSVESGEDESSRKLKLAPQKVPISRRFFLWSNIQFSKSMRVHFPALEKNFVKKVPVFCGVDEGRLALLGSFGKMILSGSGAADPGIGRSTRS
jgi:hypothetical protein